MAPKEQSGEQLVEEKVPAIQEELDPAFMDLADEYETDEDLEENGVWIAWGNGKEFQIAAADNARAIAARDRLQKPYLQQIRRGGLPDEIATRIATEVMVEGVVKNWRTRDRKDQVHPWIMFRGEQLPYSRDNAIKVLTALKILRRQISLTATEHESFRKAALEDAAKN